MKNKTSFIFAALLVLVNILWWFTDIKARSGVDTDDSMLGWALLSVCIVFTAATYTLVKLIVSVTKKQYRWLYTYLPALALLIALFLVKWAPAA